MHALSVLQPWAALIIHGDKTIETRSWQTRVRGRIAVHASGRRPADYCDLCQQEPFRSIVKRMPPEMLARGVVLGTVELRDCVRVEEIDLATLDEQERSFGNFQPGRWAWLLDDPRPLETFIPIRGRLGVFEIECV